MTMNASGIRDIARVVQISPNTVLAIIKAAAQTLPEPVVVKPIKNLEVDEFWSFVGKKPINGEPGTAWTASVSK